MTIQRKATKKATKKKVSKRRPNPDLHGFLSGSLKSLARTRDQLDKSENYLIALMTSTNITDEDLRKMNDVDYKNINPLYEFYNDAGWLATHTKNLSERAKDIVDMVSGSKSGAPKKYYPKKY